MVARNAQLTGVIKLVRGDTFAPVPNVPVWLQLFDPTIGDFRTVLTATTAADGQVRIPFRAPTVEGTYRYRAAWPGQPPLRDDHSPEQRLTVA